MLAKAGRHSLSDILAKTSITILFLSSCSPERPETQTYFSKVTKFPICKNAIVKNKKFGSYDYSKDPTYSVSILAKKDCLTDFLKIVGNKINKNCSNFDCRGFDKDSNLIDIKKIDNTEIEFTISFI